MRVTIKDIAARAGVSKTTVSFALNDPSRISEDTRKRVLEVVAELGYEPDSVARALATRHLGAIGLLLPQPIPEALANPYLVEMVRGIGEVCEDRGLSLTLLPPIKGRAEDAARKAAVDALITIGIGPGTEVAEILTRRHLPFVTIDGADSGPVPNIGIDDEAAAGELMAHLIGLGHRRLCVLRLMPETWSAREGYSPSSVRRLRGFGTALAAVGIELGGPEAPVVIAEGSFEGGREAAASLLDGPGPRPTAIVAMADIVALGACDAIARRGLLIPQDISVAGFDDIPLSFRADPPLTTVRQPGYEKGEAAAAFVLEILEGRRPANRILPSAIVVRGSSGPAPRR